jgi:hypothetical protein
MAPAVSLYGLLKGGMCKCFEHQTTESQELEKHMQVHIFRGPGRIFGFTAQASGQNLPQKYAPWLEFRSIELLNDQHTPGVDANECLCDIETYGVHVTDAHVRITEEAIR